MRRRQAGTSYPLGQRRFSAVSAIMAVLCIPLLIFIKCSLPSLAGVGSEVTNGTVIGSLSTTDGLPAMGTKVWIIPDNYDPLRSGRLPDSLIAMTDEAGDFMLRTPGSGIFNIEGFQQSSGDRVLIARINVTKGDTTYLTINTIKKPGRIQIVLSPMADSTYGYVYLPGTICFSRINNGLATIDSVPAGFIPSVNYASISDSMENHVIKNNVTISSDTTTIIADCTGWNNFKELYLNTTATGANISGNVTNYPVLVRLTDNNFDFSQAKSDGSDVSFTKGNGIPLPFEIERWSAAARTAEIWVKLDTIYGNDSSHGFIMYWGNPNTIASSNSRAVFDTANGFAGVWHFAEAVNNLPGGFKDATANAYNLTGATRTTAGYVYGIIGGAQKFGMVASDSIVGPCPEQLSGNSSFTVSFWIKVDTLLPSRPCILDFGKASYLDGGHFFIWPDYTAQFGMFDTGGFLKPSDPEPPHQNVFSIMYSAATWMYIVSAYDASAGTLTSYVNGTVMDRDTISAIRIDIAGGLHIGRPYTSYYPGYFGGSLDEVRILSIPESEERIKLSYANELSSNAFVMFK